MRCDCCKFWDELTTVADQGRCRRHAPMRIKSDVGEGDMLDGQKAVWPITRCDDWCGDFIEFED